MAVLFVGVNATIVFADRAHDSAAALRGWRAPFSSVLSARVVRALSADSPRQACTNRSFAVAGQHTHVLDGRQDFISRAVKELGEVIGEGTR